MLVVIGLFEARRASIATESHKTSWNPESDNGKKGNKSHMSITFIQHSLKKHSSFRPAGSLWSAQL